MVPPSSNGVSRAPSYSNTGTKQFRRRGYHPLWLAIPGHLATISSPWAHPQGGHARATPRSLATTCGISFLMSFPPGTEMFHFPGFAWTRLCIQRSMTETRSAGLPHSGIKGSTPVCGYPLLIAACHALHRLQMPRHPPCALSNLTDSKISSSPLNHHTTKKTTGITPRTFFLIAIRHFTTTRAVLLRSYARYHKNFAR